VEHDNGLSFKTLREANKRRLPQFKDAQGRTAHALPDGSDWSPAEWGQAVLGEMGELANLEKKIKRGDFDMDNPEVAHAVQNEVAREFADIVTYLDIYAMQRGVDLGEATRMKFNEVSRRVKASVFIAMHDTLLVVDPGQMELNFERPL
jgi:NTP pyrophosphatase (non-canonical NTP hydrolase)